MLGKLCHLAIDKDYICFQLKIWRDWLECQFRQTSTCYKYNILTGLQANANKYTFFACIWYNRLFLAISSCIYSVALLGTVRTEIFRLHLSKNRSQNKEQLQRHVIKTLGYLHQRRMWRYKLNETPLDRSRHRSPFVRRCRRHSEDLRHNFGWDRQMIVNFRKWTDAFCYEL